MELVTKTEQEIMECIENQHKVVEKEEYPYFAPSDGECYCCGRNIYQNYIIDNRVHDGYDGKEFITGCPHCHKSFCD